MRDSNILKCKNESTKSATNNGGSNIADGGYLIKKVIASKRKHRRIDEIFVNYEAAGNFV